MRMKFLASVGLVAALAGACKKDKNETGGTPPVTGTGTTGSAAASGTAGSAAGSGAAESAVAATPTATGSVTLTYVADPVGSKWTEDEHQRMEVEIEAQGQKVQMVQEKKEVKQVEVLGVTADAVTKAKITYVELLEKQAMGGKAKEKPAPHKGKAYLLEVDAGGTLKVTSADGSPVSAEEAAVLEDDEASFGKPEKMGKALDGMTFELGKRVEVPPDRAKGAFGEDDKMKIETLAFTLTKVEGNDAWFDMEMVAAGEAGQGAFMKLDVKGPVHLDLTISKPLEMTLEGTVEMSGAATAKGTMKMSGKRTKG